MTDETSVPRLYFLCFYSTWVDTLLRIIGYDFLKDVELIFFESNKNVINQFKIVTLEEKASVTEEKFTSGFHYVIAILRQH